MVISYDITSKDLEEKEIPHIVPIVNHRFFVVDRCDSNPVLSMYGDDVVPYAFSLRSFLLDDVFSVYTPGEYSVSNEYIEPDREIKEINYLKVKFWLT